jgi:uncharacterized protein YndB with AHSA1/START domain
MLSSQQPAVDESNREAANERRHIYVKRVIQASRSSVLKAWTDANTMLGWYAPRAIKVLDAQAEPRVGGDYRVTMGDEEGSATVAGVYTTLVPDEFIRSTWQWRHRQVIQAAK